MTKIIGQIVSDAEVVLAIPVVLTLSVIVYDSAHDLAFEWNLAGKLNTILMIMIKNRIELFKYVNSFGVLPNQWLVYSAIIGLEAYHWNKYVKIIDT